MLKNQKLDNILNSIIPFFIFYNFVQAYYIYYIPFWKQTEKNGIYEHIPVLYGTGIFFLFYSLYLYLKKIQKGQKFIDNIFIPFKLYLFVYLIIYVFNSLFYIFGNYINFKIVIPSTKEYSIYKEYQNQNIFFKEELKRIEYKEAFSLNRFYKDSKTIDEETLKRMIRLADDYSDKLDRNIVGKSFYIDYRNQGKEETNSFLNYIKIRIIESNYKKNMQREIKSALNQLIALTKMKEVTFIEGLILNQAILDLLENIDKKDLLKNKELLRELKENHKFLYVRMVKFEDVILKRTVSKHYKDKWILGIPFVNVKSSEFIADRNTKNRIDSYKIRGEMGNVYKITLLDYLVNPLGAFILNKLISKTGIIEKKFWKVEDILEELLIKN